MSIVRYVEYADTEDGKLYYHFVTSDDPFWLAESVIKGPQAQLVRAFLSNGVDISDSGTRRKLFEMIGQAREYCGPRPMDQAGWSGDNFAFSDGTIVSPADEPASSFLGERSSIDRLQGTIDDWTAGVGQGLTSQRLPVLVLIVALLGPVMKLGLVPSPVIFEIVLQSSREAHTLVRLLRSAMGRMSHQAARGALQFKDVLDQVSADGDPFNDVVHPLVDSDLSLSAVGAAVRAAHIARFLSAANQRSVPQVYMIFGTKSLAELAGADSDIAALAEGRTVTLTVGDDRPLGIFDCLPEGDTLPSFTHRIEAEAERNQGHLLHQFVSNLTQELADDEGRLRARLRKLMNDFKRQAGGDDGNARGSANEDAFALIYAVGRLAKDWGLLPGTIAVGRTVLGCYRRFLQAPPPRLSFDEVLVSLADAPDTVHLGYKQAHREAEEVKAANVVVRHHKAGPELMVRVNAIERVIPHWSARRTMPEVIERLVREEKRLQVKRRLVTGQKPELVYCFKLPSD